MELYEAIKILTSNKQISISSPNFVNAISDTDGFDGRKFLKNVYRILYNEGYVHRISFQNKWGNDCVSLVKEIVSNYCFNETVVTYILQSIVIGLYGNNDSGAHLITLSGEALTWTTLPADNNLDPTNLIRTIESGIEVDKQSFHDLGANFRSVSISRISKRKTYNTISILLEYEHTPGGLVHDSCSKFKINVYDKSTIIREVHEKYIFLESERVNVFESNINIKYPLADVGKILLFVEDW